jgi:hypothetical protein
MTDATRRIVGTEKVAGDKAFARVLVDWLFDRFRQEAGE